MNAKDALQFGQYVQSWWVKPNHKHIISFTIKHFRRMVPNLVKTSSPGLFIWVKIAKKGKLWETKYYQKNI